MENNNNDINTKQNISSSRGCCTASSNDEDDLLVNQQRCCKLSSHDWLSDYNNNTIPSDFNYVEVRFKNGRKDFYSFPDDLILKKGEIVAVEASPGHDIGIIALVGEIVRLQMKRKQVDPQKRNVKRIFRHARTADIQKWLSILEIEDQTMLKSRSLAVNLNLNMKINDVEYQGDKTKAIFYYTASDRVDFRELIRSFADAFKIRIEMKQIGVRQEAAKVGGIGPCGRELCCSSYMSGFTSVSTNSARIQQLSLNPQKLAGQCGKLKCCLNYEVDDYAEALKSFPSSSIPLKTKKGKAYFVKNEVFRKIMWYAYAGESNSMHAIPVHKVKYIMEQNKKGKVPLELEQYAEKATPVAAEKDDFSDDITGYI